MKKKNGKTRAQKIEGLITFAKQFVGVPYKYGATMKDAPKYFDCSGFVKYVFEHFGYDIPRSTLLQATYAGKKVKKPQPGDLIFYRSLRGHYSPKYSQGIGHVVLYLGEGRGIHAISKVYKDYPVRVEKGWVKIQSLKKIQQLEKDIVVIKRII